MEAPEQLAARHIALRERAGLTQEQEARMAGVSPTTISGIESGKITRPHLKTLLKLARALGADVGELRESGKVEAPSSQEKLFNNGVLEEERRPPTLHNEINIVNSLADYAEQEIESREQEPKYKGATAQKMQRNRNVHWATTMMEVSLLHSNTFTHDPYMRDLVYESSEVAELYRAHKRLDAALERTRGWFGDDEQADVRDLGEYRRAQRARDETIERHLGAGA